MRIAILDDNQADARKIEFALMDVSGELDFEWYRTGEEFLAAAKREPMFDIAFLDIYLKDENGMDVAIKLREFSPQTELIFSTSSRDFAVDAFRIRAVDYLVKPYSELDIVRAFARIHVLNRNHDRQQVIFKIGNELRVFHPEDIVKIVSDRHYTEIETSDRVISRVRMNFSDVIKHFDEGFLHIKRGFSVRMDYIERIKGDVVYIADGSSETMSRAKKDILIQQYTKYMAGTR